ncbi:hypothetical protein H2203_008732 [Taxawa tesnikishii (nom. ined.)]|nr:hypothetical protein H2203_008732 [Dothideales sp. JES 119]
MLISVSAKSGEVRRAPETSIGTAFRMWNTETGELRYAFVDAWPEPPSLQFSRDGRLLAYSISYQRIILRDTARGEVCCTIGGSRVFTFSPESTRIAFVDGIAIRLWNIAQAKPVSTFQGHSDFIVRLAFSPNGQLLASSSRDGTIRVWSTSSQLEAPKVTDQQSDDNAIGMSSPQDMAATTKTQTATTPASKPGISLPSLPSAADALLSEIDGDANRAELAIGSVVLAEEGEVAASLHEDDAIKLWDAEEAKVFATLVPNHWTTSKLPSRKVIISPDGRMLAYAATTYGYGAAQRGVIALWDIEHRKPCHQSEIKVSYDRDKLTATFSRDAKYFAYLHDPQTVKLLNVAEREECASVEVLYLPLTHVVFSRDADMFACGFLGGFAVWKLRKRRQKSGQPRASTISGTGRLFTHERNRPYFPKLKFSEDGTRLFAGDSIYKLPEGTDVQHEEIPLRCPLSYNRQWIRCGEEGLIWVPPDYRPLSGFECYWSASQTRRGNTIALGLASNRLVFITINPREALREFPTEVYSKYTFPSFVEPIESETESDIESGTEDDWHYVSDDGTEAGVGEYGSSPASHPPMFNHRSSTFVDIDTDEPGSS